MINSYCVKCGRSMDGRKVCVDCGLRAFDMPKSMSQINTIHRVEDIRKDYKPKKGMGFVVVLVAGFVMFGLPLMVTKAPEMISYLVFSALLMVVNIFMFKHLKQMKFKKKSKYLHMTYKSKRDFENHEHLCLNCNQLLTKDMIFCPKCARHTAEDLPIDLNLKISPIDTQHLNNESQEIGFKDPRKTQQICTQCTNDVTGKKFCSNCGKQVEDPSLSPLKCSFCNSDVSGKQYCSKCGTKVEVYQC